jgi:hypothetical protein
VVRAGLGGDDDGEAAELGVDCATAPGSLSVEVEKTTPRTAAATSASNPATPQKRRSRRNSAHVIVGIDSQ